MQNKTFTPYVQRYLELADLQKHDLLTYQEQEEYIAISTEILNNMLTTDIEVQNILGQSIPRPNEYGLSRDMDGNLNNPLSLSLINQDTSTSIPSIGIVVDF